MIKKLLHDLLGWGFVDKKIGGNFYQAVYTCKYCDKELAQDSQGNWFHLIEINQPQ